MRINAVGTWCWPIRVSQQRGFFDQTTYHNVYYIGLLPKKPSFEGKKGELGGSMAAKKTVKKIKAENQSIEERAFLNRLELIWDDHVVGTPVRLRDSETGATYDLIGNT